MDNDMDMKIKVICRKPDTRAFEQSSNLFNNASILPRMCFIFISSTHD